MKAEAYVRGRDVRRKSDREAKGRDGVLKGERVRGGR